eukprot:1624750-Prymnesium_polylepis.1
MPTRSSPCVSRLSMASPWLSLLLAVLVVAIERARFDLEGRCGACRDRRSARSRRAGASAPGPCAGGVGRDQLGVGRWRPRALWWGVVRQPSSNQTTHTHST